MTSLYKWVLAGLFALSAAAAQADSWVLRTNLEIAAIMPVSGYAMWSYKPPRLGAARIDLYKQGLVVTPDKEGTHREKTIYLDPKKGWAIRSFARGKPLASSNPRSAPPVVLAKGWDLKMVGDNGGEGLSVYRAGESSPVWSLNFEGLGDASDIRNPGINMKVVGETLFLRRHATLYALDPQTGKALWHVDMAKELNLKRSDFSPEMVFSNQFAHVGNTLLLIFDSRIVAFDLTTRKVSWQMETDSFPSIPTFLVNKGMLYLLVGCQRKLVLPVQ